MLVKDPFVAPELTPHAGESNSSPMSKEERYELIAQVARSLERSRAQSEYDLVDDMQREVINQEINFGDYIRTLN